MTRVRGVLIDIDGTLVASNDAHARSWVDALGEAGIHRRFEDVRPLIGMGSDKLLPEVAGLDADSPQGTRLVKRRREIFLREYAPALRPTRGAADLVRRMTGEGLRAVVATSANEEELKTLLEITKVPDLLDDRTSADDVERSKPDVDVVLAALVEIGLSPEEVVMLGDTPYDVEAAKLAGVDTIALRCGGWSDAELAGAAAIYDDPADLLASYDDSVLGNRRSRR